VCSWGRTIVFLGKNYCVPGEESGSCELKPLSLLQRLLCSWGRTIVFLGKNYCVPGEELLCSWGKTIVFLGKKLSVSSCQLYILERCNSLTVF